MNETTKLIEQLAAKLGTTTEYLWRILLRQAPVDATITLVHLIAAVLMCFFLWKVHLRLSKANPEERFSETGYEKYEAAAAIPMVFGAVFAILYLLIALCNFPDIINGYFNPEYWALNKILSDIK